MTIQFESNEKKNSIPISKPNILQVSKRSRSISKPPYSPEAYYYPWPNKFPRSTTLYSRFTSLLSFHRGKNSLIPLASVQISRGIELEGKAENLMAPWILWSRIEHDRTSGCRECRKRQKSNDERAGRGRERSHSRHVENNARITFKPTVGLFCSGIPDPAFCNSLSLPGDAPGSRCIPRDNATWPSQTVSTLSLFDQPRACLGWFGYLETLILIWEAL